MGVVRIAILADVHGNLPALAAVVDAIAREGPDLVLVGGDVVGRGPSGRRAVERVRKLGWPTIRGNHEEYLLAFRAGEVPAEWLELDEWAASRWMAQELGEDAAAWVAGLPFSLTPPEAPDIRLVHGTPASTREGIGPWLSDERLGQLLTESGASCLVCGHTHRPMVRQLAGGALVNVGSVGLPFDGDRRACWALLRGEPGVGWEVEIRRESWSLDELVAIYRETGFLEAGGVTAELLLLEHTLARPYLVPFLAWTEARGLTPRREELHAFRDFYRPGESLRTFHQRLAELAGGQGPA